MFRGLTSLAAGLVRAVEDALLPHTCLVCGTWLAAGSPTACAACRRQLAATQALPYCPRCARTMPRVSIYGSYCARCRKEHFWNVAAVARVGEYRAEALRRLLVALKFAGGEREADYLGALLAAVLRRQPWIDTVQMLVPVPMHWLRRWQRPCQHALLLAQAASHRLGIPVRRAAVRRVKYSPSQTRAASLAARFGNVRGCFAPARRPGVEGRTVCIIDNLLVSGATMHEVAKALRRAGARRIYAAVVARSTLPGEVPALLEPEPPPTAPCD